MVVGACGGDCGSGYVVVVTGVGVAVVTGGGFLWFSGSL
jgi:hypothetical protein